MAGRKMTPTKTLGAVVREHVEHVLSQYRGNKSKAAKALGINRRSLYRMIDRWRVGDLDPFQLNGPDDPHLR
jgi:transcriptional regulator with PAS, ATPase and Fis domain